MKTTLFLVSLLALIFASSAIAQDRTPTSAIREINSTETPDELFQKIDKFYQSIIKKEIESAYDFILTGSAISKNSEDIENLKTQTTRTSKLYGKLVDYEFVDANRPTASFIRLRYLAKHEELPMRWSFTFYNSPKNGWVITNIQFDDLAESFFDY